MTENTEEELVEIALRAFNAAVVDAYSGSVHTADDLDDIRRAGLRAAFAAICGKLGTTPEGLAELFAEHRVVFNVSDWSLSHEWRPGGAVHVSETRDVKLGAFENDSLRAESTRLRERVAELHANHVLAVGIILGVALKYNRPDLKEHAERMRAGLDPEQEAGRDSALSSPDVQSTE